MIPNQNNKYRKAVFIVVYRIRKSNNKRKIEYLLLKRKHHWIGWEFPKGGIEKSEKIFHAVKRETREETGLKPVSLLKFNASGKYRYHKLFADRPGYIGQTWTLFSAKVNLGKVKLDKKEHSSFLWLPFNKALKKLKWKNQKKCLAVVNKFLIKRI